jgi:hypothetical protein
MSRASLKIAPGGDVLALVQELAQLGPRLMLDLAPKLLTLSADSARSFLEAASGLATATLPKVELARFPEPCCEIPETPCPPRCVCEIHWRVCPGSTVHADIQVTNTGSQPRHFTFSAGPFSGPGNPPAKIQLSTQSAHLGRHDSVTVGASLTVTADFQAGAQYVAEVRIVGAYEQCVRIVLDVASAGAIVDCGPRRCEVSAGDLPVRIRAHRWYDHFQCTEPCTELLPRTPDDHR